MRYRWFSLALILGLLLPLGLIAPVEASNEASRAPTQPTSGWYENSGVEGHVFTSGDPDLDVVYIRGYVYPYTNTPKSWLMRVVYTNTGNNPTQVTCEGNNPVRENVWKKGELIQTADATKTYCSTGGNPVTLQPDETFRSWAIFNFVPDKASKVVIRWGDLGKGDPRVFPWDTKVNAPAPPQQP
jgi:hypothetical protein